LPDRLRERFEAGLAALHPALLRCRAPARLRDGRTPPALGNRLTDADGLSINALVRDLRAPVTRVGETVNGRRSITADTALRVARYFGNTPQFWLNLQAV
jgi:addiction module HigA family antidote